MHNGSLKILVLFVEAMLYGMDLIHEVYENTPYKFQYIYCNEMVTGRSVIGLPEGVVVCNGTPIERRLQVVKVFKEFKPDFAVINGYVGTEQTAAIHYCKRNKIRYAIETDTPLHIPESKIKAAAKKMYLKTLLHTRYCYGFPGGTLQKENLVYYGIPENKSNIMHMSVSKTTMLKEKENLPDKEILKEKYSIIRKKVILFVGRLEAVKNVSLLINAFGELRKTRSDIVLFIVGDGSEMATLRRIVVDKCIPDVYFVGYIVFPQIVEFYKLADVFVLPSVYEPWGLVVNEAMIMGLPVVISSDVGCRQDLLENGKNGFMFESNNESELQTCLRKALEMRVQHHMTDDWNYTTYLKNFRNAVEYICGS